MFDPFKDFDTRGYLRNVVGEKDLNIVKQLEHDLFTANLADAMDYLANKRTITYRDFLQVHGLLFGDLGPRAGSDRMTTSPDLAISKAGTCFCLPHEAKRAVEEGLRLGQGKVLLRKSPGLVMGFFAYVHPFGVLNGLAMTDTVEGRSDDPAISQKYQDFDQRRGYTID